MSDSSQTILITYNPVRLTGRLVRQGGGDSSIWERLRVRAISDQSDATVTENTIELTWPTILGILRDFGSRQLQLQHNFRFAPQGDAAPLIKRFAEDVRRVRSSKDALTRTMTRESIKTELAAKGFTKRDLKPFQLEDLERLLSLPHGANFSVPGAGKTTVTFALHLLTRQPGQHLFIVAPKAAFPAWRSIVGECIDPSAAEDILEPFTVLDGPPDEVGRLLTSGATRFVMTYDLMLRQADLVTAYLARQAVHLVLDEAHRMKAGLASQRGALLLNIATLPVRRDILTGTPMPQGPEDLAAQLGFLWPGHGLDLQIRRGSSPRSVLGQLYVRTTKRQLGLPPARRHFIQIGMAEGHMALYAIVRNETLRQLSSNIRGRDSSSVDFISARRSVMRLLQLSSNPILALRGITSDLPVNSGVVDQVLSEGPSQKMRAVEDHARRLSSEGQKVVIWTIFTDSIHELERLLADLNPVSLYGAVPSGSDTDMDTREGRIARFHNDDECRVLVANPAAAGEGISLHQVCHNAIYLDRSYVSTHYLQSVDRIHRLGLKPGIDTNIFIYQTKAPPGLGSIDNSVGRRLATKIRGLQQLLDDPDLHEIALDEENADDPIDYDVDFQDLVDLVEELEGAPKQLVDEDVA